jgi:hypothetical protein
MVRLKNTYVWQTRKMQTRLRVGVGGTWPNASSCIGVCASIRTGGACKAANPHLVRFKKKCFRMRKNGNSDKAVTQKEQQEKDRVGGNWPKALSSVGACPRTRGAWSEANLHLVRFKKTYFRMRQNGHLDKAVTKMRRTRKARGGCTWPKALSSVVHCSAPEGHGAKRIYIWFASRK